MNLILPIHLETNEILVNARDAYEAKEITAEQLGDIVRMCFTTELEAAILGDYPEVYA